MKSTVWRHPVFGGAQWLWVPDATRDQRDLRMQFRRTVELSEVPPVADIVITADTSYRLYVNGQAVHRGPARGFQEHWPFDRLDVARFLRRGRNVLAVQVHQLGISNFGYIYRNAAGLLVAGQIGPVDVATGPAWKAREAVGFTRAVERLSQQTGWQEHYDARFEPLDDWKETAYDDTAWKTGAHFPGRVAGGLPWHDFEERGIPLLTSDVVTPRRRVARAQWPCAAGFEKAQNVVNLFVGEPKRWRTAAGEGCDVTLPRRGKSSASAVILDFGREVVGTLILEATEAKEGERVDLLCCESLTGVTPDILPKWLAGSKMSFGNRLTLARGRTRHEFDALWGFRYLVVIYRGRGASGGGVRVKASLRQTIYPLEESGAFSSRDETLNAIWSLCRRSVRACMLDAFVDCPWREQAQWWGDSMVISRSAFLLSADARLLARGLRIVGAQRLPGGLTPAYAPAGNPHPIVDFSLVWVISHWSYYFQTGDTALFASLRERVREVLAYFHTAPRMEGLLCKDPRYWLFLDWCRDLHKEGIPATLNLFHLWALKTAADLFALTGDEADAARYGAEAAGLRERIVARLYDPTTGVLRDGVTWEGRDVDRGSPHAVALAILLDLLPEANHRLSRDVLLPFFEGDWRHPEPCDANGYVRELLPTPFFCYYVFEALKKTGHHRAVIDVIRRWWGEWVAAGLATTPEMWHFQQGKGSISRCHAWSAHPLAHFAEILLGVTPVTPGWRRVRIEPKTIRGEYVTGTVPTPHGPLCVTVDHTTRKPKTTIRAPAEVVVEER